MWRVLCSKKHREFKAFGLSLFLHLLLFLIVYAMGPFFISAPPTQTTTLSVHFYDADGKAGEGTGGASANAPPDPPDVRVPDEYVSPDPTTPQPERPQTQTRPMQRLRAMQNRQVGIRQETTGTGTSSAGSETSAGSGVGSDTGDGDGGTGFASLPPPPPPSPKERIEASLRTEATPEYPQELIEDDVEGTVTIKILVAEDGSVESVDLVSSSGFRAMDRAAIDAGYRFRFHPGDNGRKGIWTKTFRFQLN